VLGLLGMIAAIPIDAAVFAYDEVPAEEPLLGILSSVSVAPFVTPVRAGQQTRESPAAQGRGSASLGFRAGLGLNAAF
jgi:hypothetical protein